MSAASFSKPREDISRHSLINLSIHFLSEYVSINFNNESPREVISVGTELLKIHGGIGCVYV